MSASSVFRLYITPGTGGDANTLKLNYDGNILTVTINLSAYAGDYATATQNLCLPNSFCTYDTTERSARGPVLVWALYSRR